MFRPGKVNTLSSLLNERMSGSPPENIEQRLLSHPDDDLDLIPSSLIRKYIAYSRKYCQPRLSPEAAGVLKSFYLTLRR
jgi:DNA helicase MCM8